MQPTTGHRNGAGATVPPPVALTPAEPAPVALTPAEPAPVDRTTAISEMDALITTVKAHMTQQTEALATLTTTCEKLQETLSDLTTRITVLERVPTLAALVSTEVEKKAQHVKLLLDGFDISKKVQEAFDTQETKFLAKIQALEARIQGSFKGRK